MSDQEMPIDSHYLLGGQAIFQSMPDGWRLRTGVWAPKKSDSSAQKGTLFFLNGRGDFLEKYDEFCRDMSGHGYHVASWDWRGQGLSGRTLEGDPRSHLESFDILLADSQTLFALPEFMQLPKPWYLAAHSMGGNLAVRLMMADQTLFNRALLYAPMLGISSAPLSGIMARRFVKFMCSIGQETRYAPGQGSYGVLFRSPLRQRRLTGDIVRFAQEGDAIRHNPELAIGGVTMGWSNAAFQSIDYILHSVDVSSLKFPILMFLAELEYIVESGVAESFAKRLPSCEVRYVKAARHEILREVDVIRNNVIAQTLEFLSQDKQ
jgi:lysophospholipase